MCKYDYACVYLCITYASDWDWEYVHDEPQRLGREGRPCMVKCSNKRKRKLKMSRAIHIRPISRERREMLFFFLSQ